MLLKLFVVFSPASLIFFLRELVGKCRMKRENQLASFSSQDNASILAQQLFAGWTEKLFRLKKKQKPEF